MNNEENFAILGVFEIENVDNEYEHFVKYFDKKIDTYSGQA